MCGRRSAYQYPSLMLVLCFQCIKYCHHRSRHTRAILKLQIHLVIHFSSPVDYGTLFLCIENIYFHCNKNKNNVNLISIPVLNEYNYTHTHIYMHT